MSDEIFSILTWVYLYGLIAHFVAFMVVELQEHPNVTSPYNILRVIFWFIWTPIVLIINLARHEVVSVLSNKGEQHE